MRILIALVLLFSGCKAADNPIDDMGGIDQGGDLGEVGDWVIGTHPCAGNRTDTLWCDDAQTCYVGCGTTTTGYGVYVTSNGGQSWASLQTSPTGYFDDARVNSIHRSGDFMYFGGVEMPDRYTVSRMGSDGVIGPILQRGSTVDTGFTVGTYRRSDSGRAIAESLTGVELMYRTSDTTAFVSGRGFWNDGDDDDVPNGVQILDMETRGEEFWGVGSLINQPPTVFTPKWTEERFDFGIVQLTDQFTGELWGIDVDESGVTVGGVNQDDNVGIVFDFSEQDPTDPTQWKAFSLGAVFPNDSTWVTDVCRSDGAVYVVGRYSILERGFVLRLDPDNEEEPFEDLTPRTDGQSDLPDISRCHVVDGSLVIAGKDGLFGRL